MHAPPQKIDWIRWVVWGPLVLLIICLSLPSLANVWPPNWIERRTQRKQVWERIESVGGWAALQRDCDVLVEQYRGNVFRWSQYDTNKLPRTLAVLKPWDVQFYSPTVLRDFKNAPEVPVVRIKIFGVHSTGGHSTPYFGLEVVSGLVGNYRPRPSGGGVSGNCYHTYRRVTEGIYEIY
jgi:hypothetical protein